MPPKKRYFSHFAKHRLIKNSVMLHTHSFEINVFFNLGFWNHKQWCWTKNINQNQGKTKIRKRDFKEKTRQETKKEKILMKKRNCNLLFSCCSIHETKAKKKEKWKKRQKQETKRKQKMKDKKEEKKTRARERQRKRNRKGGGQKRLREKRETLKINKKCPF